MSRANTSAPSRAKATVHAMGLNNRPSTRCRVKMGRYETIIMTRAKKTGRCTSWAATAIVSIKVFLVLPKDVWRRIFSTITTEPSTTMPKSSAPSDKRFAGMWRRSSRIAAKSREKGMVMATISALRTLPRNRKRISVTRITPSVRFRRTVCVVWCISFLTNAKRGFLGSFGRLADIQKALSEGFVHDGIYSPYRRRRFGSSSKDLPGNKFVVFIQNHDQVANTNQGLRLSELVSIDQFKLAATLLLCSPYLPLLFMGEEFADAAPFLFFTSHLDPSLAKLVTEGRRREYAEFATSVDRKSVV